MTYLWPLSRKGFFSARWLTFVCAMLAIGDAWGAAGCPAAPPARTAMIEAEYAFARAAESSVRQAFLDNLAADALVLQPGPRPGQAWYQSHPDGAGSLQWYPHVADVAASGDLGFTSGPYVYGRDAVQAFGHFLSVWRLSADCRWQVAFDGGIAHGRQPEEARVDPAAQPVNAGPSRAPEDAVTAFQAVASREGLGAALRTYARNEGFLLLLDGQAPQDLGHAERMLRRRVIKEVWREAARGASSDASLSYVVGQLGGAGAYAQIWQYDARTANLGLRVLLLTSP